MRNALRIMGNPTVYFCQRRAGIAMRTRLIIFAGAFLVSVGLLRVPASSSQAQPTRTNRASDEVFQARIKPFLATYCYGCHRGSEPAAGLDLTSYANRDQVASDPRRWTLVLARLTAGEMPPGQARQQPTTADRQAVIE